MKTKKRNIGGASDTTTSAIYKKKITTRNMHNSSSKQQSDTGGSGLCSLGNSNKPSPITRAKSSCVIKSHSDPYAFTKLDDDDKIPMKKMKVHEKTGKEIGVNTSSLSTMTEPEYLGPCEPGTSIELQGIVWLETATGLLVINVTWRGRTYVGTLMDSTKYEFTPSFSQENFGKFEGRPPNRSTRGKKRQVGNTGNHFSLRSNNIRHSRRLSESHNNDNILKKSSTRQTNNLVNYFESTNQSATASASGESDTDKNSYSKYPPNNKTRSVTRSITKLKKAILCDSNPNSADDNSGNLIKCSKANCYKRFVDMTAFQYHVQRCHNISELSNVSPEYKVMEPVNDISNTNKSSFLKLESSYEENNKINCAKESQLHETFLSKSSNCKLNGVIKKEIDVQVNSFDYNSDSEMEKNHNLASYDFGESNQDPKITESENSDQIIESKNFTKTENLSPKFQELSITLPKVSDNSLSNSDDVKKTINSSSKEIGPSVSEDKYLSITSDSQISVSKSLSTSMKTTSQNSFESYSTTIMSQSTPCIRTVTAPTVSIPVELVNTPNTLINSTVSCPTLIRPKPNQSTVSSVTHSSPNRKFKSSKSHSQTNGILDSFQIPSSSSLILKKRPLIPLKVSVNQTSNSNLNRIYPITSQINVTSSNQTSRHIRSSSISPVTPILPATSTVNSSASLITSTTTVTGTSINSSMNNIFHNGPLSIRRPSTTTNLTTGPALSTLVSLKPIQPKPKCSQSSAPITTSHIGINASSYPASQSIIVPSISGIPNIHVSHQRQILPSPITKSDFSTNIDESLIHKIESLKTSSLKRKRRKPEKKLRLNFHESNRYKKFALNPIQPKHVTNDHFISKMNNSDDFCLSVDKYKTDEENSHSPGYSDLSETNDTPAPILEKEIDLKSGECDKLVICTDFDRISTYHHNSSSSENYDDPKDLSNKPPALMPAVLSSDLVNGSTNELDYRDVKPRTTRKKNITNKKSHKLKDSAEGSANQNKSNRSEWMTTLTGKAKSSSVSNHKSFQSSSNVRQNISPVPLFSSQQSPTISLQSRDYSSSETNSKLVSVNSIPSAINDFVRTNKINTDTEKNLCSNKSVEPALQSLQPSNEDKGKGRNKTVSSPQINKNGKFSVQALTSPQEIVSRSLSFATSSTVSSIIPNTKLSNVLFKH